jgi:UDP-N-acetyl-D-glucosamine dehydrogenase
MVRAASASMGAALSGPALVSLESTTYPGTTREVLLPIFQDAGQRIAPESNRNLWLTFAPERVNPGGEDPAARQAPRLVGGLDKASGELAELFYGALGFQTARTQTPEIAEAAKLVENVYRAVNIALVNELKVSLAAQGIDIWQVLDAAETKPFGFQRFNPGPGAGGSCIPVDPRYLEFSARRAGSPVRLVELAGQIDASMAEHVVNVCQRALATQNKTLAGSRILLLGVAYKAGVDIITESPALRIAACLAERGAAVAYHDPHVPGPLKTKAPDLVPNTSLPWSDELFERFDAFVLVTDHGDLAYAPIAERAPLIVDTRGHKLLKQAGPRYFSA